MRGPCTVITGANRGLGLHLARRLAVPGSDLLLLGRTPSEVGGEHIPCDLGDPHAVATAAEHHLADRSVGLLVNNAGVFSQAEEAGLGGLTPDDLARMLLVNAVAPALLTRAALRRAAPGLLIVNILSDMAFPGDWDGTYPAYRASKALLWSLTVNTNAEAARHGGKAIGIDPGWMRTDMGGPDAPDDPELIADGIAALCARGQALQGGAVYRASDGATIRPGDGGTM